VDIVVAVLPTALDGATISPPLVLEPVVGEKVHAASASNGMPSLGNKLIDELMN
jgi:hypothetical protein